MNTGQKIISFLLIVIAGLLILELGQRPVEAQPFPFNAGTEAVGLEVVGTTIQTGTRLFRLWSDGTVEENPYNSACQPGPWCGWVVVPE